MDSAREWIGVAGAFLLVVEETRKVLVQVHERDRYGHLRGVFACIGPATGPIQARETIDKREIASATGKR